MKNLLTAKTLARFSWALIFFSVVSAALLRFGTLFNYTGFQGDQAFHGGFIMDIWQGKLPTLGSTTSAGGHSLTPLHYYLFWVFTIFGSHPVFQALPNAVFSFFSVPALIYFIYRLLNKSPKHIRLFISAVSGFWWTFFYNDVLFASFEWNPNSIAYFGLSFILLVDLILHKYIGGTKTTILAWILLGINTALFTSLHTTTLLLYPIIFTLFVFYNIYKDKSAKLPLLSVLSFVLTLAPYWIGEIQARGANTKALIRTLLGSTSTLTALEKINRIFFNYFEIGSMYLEGTLPHIATFFLGLVLVIAIYQFVGNTKMWTWYLMSMLLYFLISMNYTGIYFAHYKEVFWSFPIILTAVTLNYFFTLKPSPARLTSFALISIIVSLSVFANTRQIYRTFQQKYGVEREIGVSDYIDIFSSLPTSSTVCTPYIPSSYDRSALTFIDKYNSKKNINILGDCKTGYYQILPKYSFKDIGQKQINTKNPLPLGTQVVQNGQSYYVLLVK